MIKSAPARLQMRKRGTSICNMRKVKSSFVSYQLSRHLVAAGEVDEEDEAVADDGEKEDDPDPAAEGPPAHEVVAGHEGACVYKYISEAGILASIFYGILDPHPTKRSVSNSIL